LFQRPDWPQNWSNSSEINTQGVQNTRGVGKICDFEQLTVSIDRYYKVVCALSNDDIADD